MKKRNLLLALASVALLLTGCENNKTQYFGMGSVAYYNEAPRDYHIETTIDYVAVEMQGAVIKKLRLDTVQLYARVIRPGLLTLGGTPHEIEGDIKSKWELLDDYDMRRASPIGKEWYEQAEAFEEWVVGKKLADVKAGVKNKVMTDGVTVGVTIIVDKWVAALEEAVANRVKIKGEVAGLGVGGFNSVSKDRTTGALDGQDWYIAGAAFDADKKVLAARLDTYQLRYVNDEGRAVMKPGLVQVDYTAKRVKGKQELKDAYNMKPASPIGKEWYEQAASLVEYLKGKTVAEALGTGAKLTNGADVGCTMNIGGYRTVLLEAEHTAFNSRVPAAE
ncbi:MAG: hypothetical protein BWY30_01051 [Tenericutes bacterium ADurb.Bin239]|nr:MAG: hypothetical protein BWY30_01051 [Tenericutes bacterium ADurb.Bin239]